MSNAVHGEGDGTLTRIADALSNYQHQHPDARVEIHRRNSVTVYIRVIDPDLAPSNRADRHDILWHFLDPLPEGDQSQVSLLLALTPEEAGKSFARFEFDHPVASGL